MFNCTFPFNPFFSNTNPFCQPTPNGFTGTPWSAWTNPWNGFTGGTPNWFNTPTTGFFPGFPFPTNSVPSPMNWFNNCGYNGFNPAFWFNPAAFTNPAGWNNVCNTGNTFNGTDTSVNGMFNPFRQAA